MSEVTINAKDGGAFSAYFAMPSAAGPERRAAVLLIQEIFGVNRGMRQLTDYWASEGYLALCPDLFWRQEPGIQLTDKTPEEWQKAMALMNGFDQGNGVEDLKASLAYLRALPQCSGKVGAVGYCLGGRLAYFMATRSDANASVGYYGVGIESLLGEATHIKKPLLLHIAARDEYCPPSAQDQIRASLSGNPQVTVETYADVDHGFARPGGQHYNGPSADLANGRTDAFFKRHLGR